jgi:Tfp pilus assembly protein PilV
MEDSMRFRRAQAGVSMLEIMITLFIVMTGMLVVMASFLAISRSHHYSEKMEIATTLSRLEMERIRNKTFAAVQSETGNYREYVEHPDFRHTVTVTQNGNLKEIILRVYFENDHRRAELRTYISNI